MSIDFAIFEEVEQSFEAEAVAEPRAPPDMCPTCEQQTLVYEDEITCRACGTIVESYISSSQEWRYYGDNDNTHNSDPNRCGLPMNALLPNLSMSTIILSSGRGRKMYMKQHMWSSVEYKDRTMLDSFTMIQNKGAEGKMDRCISDKTKYLYKTLTDNMKKKTSKDKMIAWCNYLACKNSRSGADYRKPEEISEIYALDDGKISKAMKRVNQYIYAHSPELMSVIKPTLADDYIRRYGTLAGMSEEVVNYMISVWEVVDELGLMPDTSPASVAVACIQYGAVKFGLVVDKELVSEVSGISENTVDKSYKKLLKSEDILQEILA